jgi:hypothetical protein
MSRDVSERMADVRRLLAAARAVHADRSRVAPRIREATGLSLEGVELGFASLELDASDAELGALVEAAGDASSVHVVLSSNVFVAPLRALAVARAASGSVTVRPSPRDPVLTEALVQAAGDPAVRIVRERDAAESARGEIHVYGRNETIEAIRARALPGTVVRAHGAGLGVCVVTETADIALAAEQIAADVVPFDQRGCLSPRMVIVSGTSGRAERFADALDHALRGWGERVPRGEMSADEREEAARWTETLRFAGRAWPGDHHAVGLGPAGPPPLVPPPGRHVLVLAAASLAEAADALAPVATHVVAVGSDDVLAARRLVPSARVSSLGQMQHPPLDGPVDRRRERLG